jgi:hypothetical protein
MTRIGLLCLTVLALLEPAIAAENGCQKFAWSVANEQAWFGAPDKLIISAGETLAAIPKAAFTVKLQPAGEATFVLPPERKARLERWFGGMLQLPAVAREGIYQVTMSDEAWVDIVQEGQYARSVGSTGRSDCPGIRKSVRLELAPSPFILQLSAVATPLIVIAIAQVE